jgi:hypothetical protein
MLNYCSVPKTNDHIEDKLTIIPFLSQTISTQSRPELLSHNSSYLDRIYWDRLSIGVKIHNDFIISKHENPFNLYLQDHHLHKMIRNKMLRADICKLMFEIYLVATYR